MVRLRLKRLGRLNRPFFRIEAMDGRRPRDGREIEDLGFYDPLVAEGDRRLQFKADRVSHWLSLGAQPSHAVVRLLRGAGFDAFPVWVERGGKPKLKPETRERKMKRKPHPKGLSEDERRKMQRRLNRKAWRKKAAERKTAAASSEKPAG